MAAGTVHAGSRLAHDGTELAYERRVAPDAAAIVLVVHGFGEHYGRYDHVTAALVDAGLGTLAYDMRGHGRSGGRRGHVRRFADHVDDLAAMIADARDLAEGRPVLALAHSHGGLVTTRLLVDRPDALDGAVLSAPFLGLALRPPRLQLAVSGLASRVAGALPLPTGITPEMCTRSEEVRAAAATDALAHQTATPRWFAEARRAQAHVLAHAASLVTPLLVLLPGDDRIADGAATRRVLAAAACADHEVLELPGFYHESFNDPGREAPIGAAVSWLRARAARA